MAKLLEPFMKTCLAVTVAYRSEIRICYAPSKPLEVGETHECMTNKRPYGQDLIIHPEPDCLTIA